MVPAGREAHLAVLMIGYSDPLTRRLASSARPSPPVAWCAVGWRLQGQRSAQRKGSSGWPQMPAPVRRPKAEALSGGDREALAEVLGKQARVRRSRVFCAASTEISGAITPARMRISHERSSWRGAHRPPTQKDIGAPDTIRRRDPCLRRANANQPCCPPPTEIEGPVLGGATMDFTIRLEAKRQLFP